jgi:hypothetical protein
MMNSLTLYKKAQRFKKMLSSQQPVNGIPQLSGNEIVIRASCSVTVGQDARPTIASFFILIPDTAGPAWQIFG